MNLLLKYFFSLAFFSALIAYKSVEHVRDSIIAILLRDNPHVLPIFYDFYNQFDISVHSFFERNNHESFTTHIARMEQELILLTAVINDPRFKSVCLLLKNYRAPVAELIAVLKRYVGSVNSIGLALAVKQFEFLLPQDLKQKGHFWIFRSLHHRLLC